MSLICFLGVCESEQFQAARRKIFYSINSGHCVVTLICRGLLWIEQNIHCYSSVKNQRIIKHMYYQLLLCIKLMFLFQFHYTRYFLLKKKVSLKRVKLNVSNQGVWSWKPYWIVQVLGTIATPKSLHSPYQVRTEGCLYTFGVVNLVICTKIFGEKNINFINTCVYKCGEFNIVEHRLHFAHIFRTRIFQFPFKMTDK